MVDSVTKADTPQASTKNPSFVDVTSNSTQASKPNCVFTAGMTFDKWANTCADSIKDLDSKGEPIFGFDVESFDMAGGSNAGEVHKQRALDVAASEIKIYDANGDGEISPTEEENYDLAEAEGKYGKFDAATAEKLKKTSSNANIFMDLNKSEKVNQKEFAAFMDAMDLDRDGKITRQEYITATGYFDKMQSPEAVKFRDSVGESYKRLFGVDPTKQ